MQKIFSKKSNIFFYVILGVIFLFAIFIRFKTYIEFRPFWHDECSLAISIISNGSINYFGALEHQQSAPPFFMLATKILSLIFGIKEWVLRLLPFAASVLSVPLFYIFSVKLLDSKFSILIANFIFGINYYLIYYGQEFKQYSTDVFCFLLLFILLSKLDFENISKIKAFTKGLMFSVFMFFSIPSVVVLAASFFCELVKNKFRNIRTVVLFYVHVLITFSFLFLTTLSKQRNDYLLDYWNNGFIAFNIRHFFYFLQSNLQYYFYPNKMILFCLLLITGGLVFFIRIYKSKYSLLLVGSFAVIILGSMLHIYPVMQRVSLYIVPILIILLIKPLDLITLNEKYFSFLVLCLLSLYSYNLSYIKNLTKDGLFVNHNPRVVMQQLIKNYNDRDLIIINSASDSDFKYYAKYYNAKFQNYVFVQLPVYDKEVYFQILNTIPSGQNVWFYYSYDFSHSPVIPFLKEWQNGKNVRLSFDKDGSYLSHVEIR